MTFVPDPALTEMERRIERVLARVVDTQLHSTLPSYGGDRGDLTSDIADVVRAYIAERWAVDRNAWAAQHTCIGCTVFGNACQCCCHDVSVQWFDSMARITQQ